jgi:hypothetical protein
MGNPAQDSDNRTYDLCGLIVHRGTSVHNGHYMAYVMPSPTQKRWFLCNDATVTPTSAHIVLEQQAYVLLYRRSPQSDGHELRARQDEGRRQHVLKYLYGKPMPTLPVVEPVCFISSYWLKKYDLGLETGPPSNACVLCKHGHLLSHERKCLKLAVDQGLLTARPVVPIPIRLWEWLSSRPPLSTSSSSAAATAANATSSCAMLRRQDTEGQCRACAEEGRIFTAQRQTEVDYFDFLTTDCVAEGENSDGFWYIIDAAWMRRWQTWFYNTRRVPLADQIGREQYGYDEDVLGVAPPGPITNYKLLVESDGPPRPGLQPGVHFRGVNKGVWDFLARMHGGGPVIRKKRLDLYDASSG